MKATDIVPHEEQYQPTDSQLERAEKIRRFNTLYIYLPVGLISAVVLIAVLGILYLAINPPRDETVETISGVADAVTILGIIPLLVLCAIFPTIVIAAIVQGRRQGTAPIRQLQILMWRLDSGVAGAKVMIRKISQKLANPFITIQGVLAFVRTFVKKVTTFFR